MSRCGRTEQLEALVLGELPAARVTELEAHSAHCAVCHHELRWLRSERLLFEHRLARGTVEKLWEGFAAARPAPAQLARPNRAWGRVAFALAASVVLLVGVTAKSPAPRVEDESSGELQAPMSLEEMSHDVGSVSDRGCSELKPGMGFACGPYLPASFALRE